MHATFRYLTFLLAIHVLSSGNLWAEMKTPETSKHFEKLTDPESGVVSYVLKTDVTPQQQSFYFVNPCMTEDGRFMWFYCAGNRPSGMRNMGVVDFQTDEIRYFPELRNFYASPYVDPQTGDLYWATNDGIYSHSPFKSGAVQKISGVPESFPEIKHRLHLVCHLTRNASKTKFFLDSYADNQSICGELDIESGDYTEWGRMNFIHNHAQFNPVDDDLVLICKEYWADVVTRELHRIPTNKDGVFERLWLWRRGEEPQLVPPINRGRATHEWWGADGKSFYYCAYPKGIACYELQTGDQRMICSTPATEPATHAHSSPDDRCFVYDQPIGRLYRGCAWNVWFYNATTHKTLRITNVSQYNTEEKPSVFHPDPHPQFVAKGCYIVSTVNVDGKMAVLVTPVRSLIKMTK